MSLAKVKKIEDPESFLRRSVLINNTIKRLQREVREEKMMRHGGYTSRLSSCSSYRKSFACSRLTDLSVVDDGPVLDDEPGLMEPEGPSPLDSITIDKSHHNSPSIMHNSRKRPLSDESEDDCDVQAVLSQIYIPPTPCIISSIDDDDNAMHCGTSSALTGTSSSLSSGNCNSSVIINNHLATNNPCDSSSELDSVTFTNCTSPSLMNDSINPSSSTSLDCSLSNVSSMLISGPSAYSSALPSTTSQSHFSSTSLCSSSSASDYHGPDYKRARLGSNSSDDDDDDPTTSLLSVVNEEDDVVVDVVGDSEMSDWPTPPSTPTSLSLLTSAAAAAAAVVSSATGMTPLAASLALSYSISLAGSSVVHHPHMSMSPISAAAAAAAAAMQATSSCLLGSHNLCSRSNENSKSSSESDDDFEDNEDMEGNLLEVGSSQDDASQQSCGQISDNNNINGASCILRSVSSGWKDENSNDGSSGNSNSSSDSQSSDDGIQFPSIVSSWGNMNNLSNTHNHHPHHFNISSPAFPIFSSSFANTNPTVLSPSTMGNGLMMSPLPLTNPCSIPTFVTPSLPLPTSCENDDDDDEDEDEEDEENENQSEDTKDANDVNTLLITPQSSSDADHCCDITAATLVNKNDEQEATTSLGVHDKIYEQQEALQHAEQHAAISSQITFIPSETSPSSSNIECVTVQSSETSESKMNPFNNNHVVDMDIISQASSDNNNEGSSENGCTTSATTSNNDNNNENNNNNSLSPSSSPSTASSAPSSPLDADKQAQQQQYSSCGHSSIFGELQSVVFHNNLIASLES